MSTPPPEFRAVYEAHFNFVWCSLRRLGVREADVLDQAQKVFLTAHFKLAEFEGRSQITTWLFGICQRVAAGRLIVSVMAGLLGRISPL